jgi:hypothetical protein
MEKSTESVTFNAKHTESSTLNDTNFAKGLTLSTPLPNVIILGLLFISTLVIIYFGYVHGNMSITAVYKNLQS